VWWRACCVQERFRAGWVRLMDEPEVGRRIAHWRRRRGMSQALFADRIGRSKSWVEKIEAGTRRASLPHLEQIAAVLRIDLNVLIRRDQAAEARECLDSVEIARLRDALLRYDAITTTFRKPDGEEQDQPTVPDVAARVRHCWMSFQASQYATLGRNLPSVIGSAQCAVLGQHAGARSEARGLLSQAYQLAASMLRKCGEFGLEIVAAERGLVEAELAGDRLLIAAASFRLANAVLDLGDSRRAVEMAVTVAGKLAVRLGQASTDLASLYGHILLQGAMAAANHEDRRTVRDLLAEAGAAASRVGRDSNAFYVAFGPTNVSVHRVSALVRLGDGGLAVEAAAAMTPDHLAGLPRERRATHVITLGLACSQAGYRDKALRALLDAEQIAAEEVHCREQARGLIRDLLRRERGKPSLDLSRLAERAGVNP
jgi:transcriptional regulator with XRE-family HTH domain